MLGSFCVGTDNGQPCGYHTRKSQDAYAATLEALGCICRALLALGEESCCLPKERPPSQKRRGSKGLSRMRPAEPTVRASHASTSRESIGYCSQTCGDNPDAVESSNFCSKGCCDKPDLVEKSDPCSKGCCDDKLEMDRELRPAAPFRSPGKSDDACCKPQADGDLCVLSAPVDVEKGLAGREHIVLSVSGMTCSGCETKLQRVLSPLASVNNLKTSLVLGRAEFDLDHRSGSLADVLKHLGRTTEFKCERVSHLLPHGAVIDVIAPGEATTFVRQRWPKGVTDVALVGKKTLRIVYDPEVVGARDLVEHGWDEPLELGPVRPDPTLAAGNKHVRHIGYMTLLSSFLTIPVLVLGWAPLPENEIAYNSVSLALATLVQVAIAGPFYPKALKALVFVRVIEMDLLIVLSTTAAYVFSVVSFGYLVAGTPLSTGSFFETSTLLVTLIMVGRFVAALACHKAVESISVNSLQPTTAILVDLARRSGDREIDARLLQYGDTFRVVPESRFTTDGTVVLGSSEVDESMITGESHPVEKGVGSAVIAGTVNGSGTLNVRLTRLPGANTIDMIAGMVDEAKLSKPKLQHLADRVASYFVPVIVALTAITFIAWIAVGVTVQHLSGAESTIQAITYAITVLIVSCPCAIGLAVPMVIVIATGVGAEHGIMFKSAESIEVAHKTTHVVLDKTGTLTEGKLAVVSEEYVDGNDPATSASLLLGLVQNIKHPVSLAVAAHLKSRGVSTSEVVAIKSLPGKGVQGTTPSGLLLRAGNPHWLNLSSSPHITPFLSQPHTLLCFATATTTNTTPQLTAILTLFSPIRPSAAPAITALHKLGIAVHVLSGDAPTAVHAATDPLGIPRSLVRVRCSPADKKAYLDTLLLANPPATTPSTATATASKQTRGAAAPVVIFCGDGTNDAPALARATVGIAMPTCEGQMMTMVPETAADVVLMRPDLGGIVKAVELSRRAVRRIWWNFAWSFVYNAVAVLLAAGVGGGGVRIPPQFAGLGELVSVLPVVVAAVMLRWEGW